MPRAEGAPLSEASNRSPAGASAAGNSAIGGGAGGGATAAAH
jgi:hypothetical protein